MKKTAVVALAFIGLVVGAGFASGQEVLQYFVSHGIRGLWGAIVAGVVMGIAGMAILQLGSYFRAKEHAAVYDKVTHPVVSRILDLFTSFTLFCIGFVMIAGAGANLKQQFGLPIWVGSVIMVVLVFGAGLLDVDKLTSVIGMITPFIIIFVIGASAYAFATADKFLREAEPITKTLTPAIGNWLLSAFNYVGLALALAVSMAIVMGGNELNLKAAGIGGLAGGLTFGLLLVISVLALFVQIDSVKDAPMPLLELVNAIHPALGTIMSLIIFGMIFNTAIGVYYALVQRISADRPKRFVPTMAIVLAIGFGLSFVGFESLIAYLYPIIGYVGAALIGTLVFAWMRARPKIASEGNRRIRIRELIRKRWERGKKLTPPERRELKAKISDSNLDDKTLHRDMSRAVVAEIENEDGAEVEPEWEQTATQWAIEEREE